MKIEYKKIVTVCCGVVASLSIAGGVDTKQNYIVMNKNNNSIKLKEVGIGDYYHTVNFGTDSISQNCYDNIDVTDTLRGKWFLRLSKNIGNTVHVWWSDEDINVISHLNGRPMKNVIEQRKQR